MTKIGGIKQRADYTFKYNKQIGRHGWLRLTPAYSVKIVEEIASTFTQEDVVLEPFSGTATTALVLAEHGINSVSFDINPFLAWFGNAKTKNYAINEISELRLLFKKIIRKAGSKVIKNTTFWRPAIHNIERWWDTNTLKSISAIHKEIESICGCPTANEKRTVDLIWIAFCRLVIESSSAAFNHVSMSFKDVVATFEYDELAHAFTEIFESIIHSTLTPIYIEPKILLNDSRVTLLSDNLKFDGVITSPPYPNRISYIRELRPYMYWTKFLNISRDAGVLDWDTIGGTWGIATSRLKEWKPRNNIMVSESLKKCVEDIGMRDDKNADLMARYVHKYFDDVYDHFTVLKYRLNPGAKLNYIIGNSTFYGVEVPSDIIYMDILENLGFVNIDSKIVRKRNCKKGLFEYLVTAETSANTIH